MPESLRSATPDLRLVPDPGEPALDVPARGWFARSSLEVARDLLGSSITHRTPEGVVTVRLTEVEAYDGERDPGSHAFRGRSERNRAMYGEPGHLYVYRHLGLHHCVNVVCGPLGQASAVLLRAGEVTDGAELARARRLAVGVCDSDRQIARGPARLAVALGLDLDHYGLDVTDVAGDVVVHRDTRTLRPAIATGPRVGVSGDGGDASVYPWRLWLTGDPTVSAYRPAYRRTR
ncbi:DNA-3-methyladenine glycosylase [Oerskovia enterophila]|uniref:Putative 3-methyladenine DNA glycosylase n=1 Tax=Oerskovia enterophila TaxID=43678 RepID=A0A163SXY2_9CELL|nr:putative 3-methyladenine DNA glycosylase [Oerskovia enterophila]OCI29299.1 putative 3-methyladenine DNA glycosylase [Oerskovia enterophila]